MLAVILYAISHIWCFESLSLRHLCTFFLLFDNFHYKATNKTSHYGVLLVDAWNVKNCWMAISKTLDLKYFTTKTNLIGILLLFYFIRLKRKNKGWKRKKEYL